MKGVKIMSNTLNPISILISIFSILVSLYICRKNVFTPLKTESIKKQLEYIYLPLFTFLEPYLYKEPSILIIQELIVRFEKLKITNYEIINPHLIIYFDILKRSIKGNTYSYKAYENLCIYIDSEFEKARKYLSYPTRDFAYKHRYDQFDSDKRILIKQIFEYVGNILLFSLYGLFISFIVTIISKILSLFT